MSIQAVVAMQACAHRRDALRRLSAKSIRAHRRRGAVVIITADGQFRRPRIALTVVDEALGPGGCEGIATVLGYKRTGSAVLMQRARRVVAQVAANQPDTCEPTWVDAEHPLFILYTSGSTGKPKASSIRRAAICRRRY
jgi:acetyl-CoA synthetase